MGDRGAGPSSACNNVAVNHDAVLSEVLVNQTTLSKVASGAQGPEVCFQRPLPFSQLNSEIHHMNRWNPSLGYFIVL